MMAPVDGWEQYQKLVMDKLEEHDNRFSLINEKLTQIQVDIATLKVKAGVWGGVAGLIPVIIAVVMFFATNTQKWGFPFAGGTPFFAIHELF